MTTNIPGKWRIGLGMALAIVALAATPAASAAETPCIPAPDPVGDDCLGRDDAREFLRDAHAALTCAVKDRTEHPC